MRGHNFQRLRRGGASRTPGAQPSPSGLRKLLQHDVVERFARIGNANLPAILLDLPGSEDTEVPPDNPGHPACAQHADNNYCRESWLLHLAELHRRPETHWHKCDLGLFCAIVPIVYGDRCLAAVKIACPALMPQENFERQVELLDVLAKEFVTSNAEYLARFSQAHPAGSEAGTNATPGAAEYVERRPDHPRILKAIQKIESQLADPKLNVAHIAHQLGMDSSYLGHLFVDQVGQRMSQFIAARRTELAKKLLVTTDWQIKRIAQETGHANPNWFSYVFRTFSGLTPGAYRKQSHDPARAVPRR